MSYYASGYGELTIRTGISSDEIRKLYSDCIENDKLYICGRIVCPDAESIVNAVAAAGDGFSEVAKLAGSETDNSFVLCLTHEYEKYHEEDIQETLKILAPITSDGEVEFAGEDDSHWVFRFENGCFTEYNGSIVYDCDIQNEGLPEQTEIHAVRMDGMNVDQNVTQNVTVTVYHTAGLDVLKALDACMAAWYQTDEGRTAWEYTSGDFNIGDWLAGMHPSDEFTRAFGFVIDAGNDHKVIEIDFDRVLGSNDREEEDDLL